MVSVEPAMVDGSCGWEEGVFVRRANDVRGLIRDTYYSSLLSRASSSHQELT